VSDIKTIKYTDIFLGPVEMKTDTPISDSAYFNQDATMHSLCEEMKRMERELNAANDRIRLLIAERDTARRQADQQYKLREEFRELLGTDDVEHGVAVVREMKERIKRLEEELERTKQDRNAIAKKTREPLLLKLDRAAERIKRLEEAGDRAIENSYYPDRVKVWTEAKEAKP
jgi:chromosome segregation ATPase